MGTLANVKIEPCNAIFDGTDLGFIDGDIEVSLEEQLYDVTAHQHGTNVLDAIRTGKVQSVTMNLKESSVSQLASLIGMGGTSASTAAAEVTEISIASVASIGGKYFDISSANNAVRYRVWFDVNNGSSAPTLTGYTGVEVDLDATPTVAETTTALQTALENLAAFTAVESGGNTVTVTNAATGPADDAVDGTTGFTITVTTQGAASKPAWGMDKDFTAVSNEAAVLILHPVVIAAGTATRDLVFWKAYPLLQSITFSGESAMMIPVEFKIYPDLDRPSNSRYFSYGEDAY